MRDGLKTIKALHKRLQKENIPHNYVKDRDGMRIDYPESELPKMSFLENYASKGNEQGEDLLEIIDYSVDEYRPSKGYYTLQDAMDRIDLYEWGRNNA